MKTYTPFVVVALVFFLGACGGQGEAGSAMQDTAEAQNKAVLERAYEAFNTGNLDALDTLMTANPIEHQVMPGVTATGVEAVKQTIGMLREAFPDFRITANHMIAEGDYVVAHFTMSGTQNGPFMGAPATGKRFEIQGLDLVRFENGKAAEHWGYQEDIIMMEQLGMMPAEDMMMPAPPVQ